VNRSGPAVRLCSRLLSLAVLAGCAGAPAPRPPVTPLSAEPGPTPVVPPDQADLTPERLAEPGGDLAAAEAADARLLAAADDPVVRLRRALLLERLGRDAEAIAELERLRAADPAQAGVRARLAERYEAVGRLGDAEAELRSLAEATPERPEGWRRLAAFCARHGLAEQASAAEARAREAEARPRRELRPLRPSAR
jgi:predicted Zn-dependent protease